MNRPLHSLVAARTRTEAEGNPAFRGGDGIMPAVSKKPLLTPQDTLIDSPRKSCKGRSILKANQLFLAAIFISALAAPIDTLAGDKSMAPFLHPMRPPAKLPIEGELPSLGSASGWLNSQPLTAANLRGKVVLIEFWTYTCVNWLRTLPYVRAWAEKYKDHGLVVIGVHSPEFAL